MGIEEFGGGQTAQADVLVVTTNDVPGYQVTQVIGEVFGLTVRSRHLGSQIGAGLKSMIGGELKGLTKTLVETRNQAMERLVEHGPGPGRQRGPDDAVRRDRGGGRGHGGLRVRDGGGDQ
ncbi:Putative heavy-metal-binding, partial [Streptomyces sp. Ncost-T6T-2b]